MKTLGDTLVTDIMYQMAKDIKSRGGRVFLIVGPEQSRGCTNCNGHDHVHLEILVGGPYDVMPESIATNDETIVPTWINDAWYKSKKVGFPCPVCNGGTTIQTGQLEAMFAGER